MENCPLCASAAENVLFANSRLRVVSVGDDALVPAFCRVIWREHVAEMTDLAPQQRAELMEAVFAVEAGMRALLRPDKINLASFGNVVPHLHWHLIARFADDAHFPDSVWAPPRRPERRSVLPLDWEMRLTAYLQRTLPAA